MVNQVGLELELAVTEPAAPGKAGKEMPLDLTVSVCPWWWPHCTAEAQCQGSSKQSILT